jgi:hypothetical protein
VPADEVATIQISVFDFVVISNSMSNTTLIPSIYGVLRFKQGHITKYHQGTHDKSSWGKGVDIKALILHTIKYAIPRFTSTAVILEAHFPRVVGLSNHLQASMCRVVLKRDVELKRNDKYFYVATAFPIRCKEGCTETHSKAPLRSTCLHKHLQKQQTLCDICGCPDEFTSKLYELSGEEKALLKKVKICK